VKILSVVFKSYTLWVYRLATAFRPEMFEKRHIAALPFNLIRPLAAGRGYSEIEKISEDRHLLYLN